MCGNHFSQDQSRLSRSRVASATPSTVGSCQVTAWAIQARNAARTSSASPRTVIRETLVRSIPVGTSRTVRWVSSRLRNALCDTGSRSISAAVSLTRSAVSSGTSCAAGPQHQEVGVVRVTLPLTARSGHGRQRRRVGM